MTTAYLTTKQGRINIDHDACTVPCLTGDPLHRGTLVIERDRDGDFVCSRTGSMLVTVGRTELRGWAELDGPAEVCVLRDQSGDGPEITIPAAVLDELRGR